MKVRSVVPVSEILSLIVHLVDIDVWAETVQAAVTAIHKAGATSHYILLPGSISYNVPGPRVDLAMNIPMWQSFLPDPFLP